MSPPHWRGGLITLYLPAPRVRRVTHPRTPCPGGASKHTIRQCGEVSLTGFALKLATLTTLSARSMSPPRLELRPLGKIHFPKCPSRLATTDFGRINAKSQLPGAWSHWLPLHGTATFDRPSSLVGGVGTGEQTTPARTGSRKICLWDWASGPLGDSPLCTSTCFQSQFPKISPQICQLNTCADLKYF